MIWRVSLWLTALAGLWAAPAAAQEADEPAAVAADLSARPRVWLHFDYLLWHVSNGPLPAPVLTVNNNPNSIAALNEPGTRVLVGGSERRDFDYGFLSGLRLAGGAWLDADGTVGAAFSGFRLGPHEVGYTARSPGGAGPVLAIPVNAASPFGSDPAGETTLNAGGAPSAVRIRSSSEAWGGEVNALFVPRPDDDVVVGFLLGGRYFGLRESFDLSDTFLDAANAGTVAVRDAFDTRNHFGGVNLGGQAQWAGGRWQASVAGKVALGVVSQRLEIRGATAVSGAPFGMGDATFPGGVFTQASNIGSYSQERFGVLPEANVRVAFAVTRNLRVSVGYDALFLNSVLRPGNQIDRTVNVNQSVLFGGAEGGPQRPAATLTDSGLWMHGVSVGVGFSF